MATNYDDLGADYLLVKALPWKRFSEAYSFFRAVGPLQGRRVIDIACGEGFYSRQLRAAGAEVLGVDVSQEMIRLAREREAQDGRGIRYEVADARDLPRLLDALRLGPFDLAVAQWLLDYAETRDALRGMCQAVARSVRPGGRFVHMGGCFDALFGYPESFAQYGVQLEVLASCGDGSRCRWTVRRGDDAVSAENTMWTPPTITRELEAAGFHAVRWPGAEISPEGVTAMGETYWTSYRQHPYHAVTCATRDGVPG